MLHSFKEVFYAVLLRGSGKLISKIPGIEGIVESLEKCLHLGTGGYSFPEFARDWDYVVKESATVDRLDLLLQRQYPAAYRSF